MIDIGISDYFKKNNTAEAGGTYLSKNLNEKGLVELVQRWWYKREPGTGESDLTRKVLVPLPVKKDNKFLFKSSKFNINNIDDSNLKTLNSRLISQITKREGTSEDEEYHIEHFLPRSYLNVFDLECEPVLYCKAVCYSAKALMENNGQRSTDKKWEIITIIGSSTEHEPMHPLTMARNMLELVGGTKSEYTAKEFAEAVHYWSTHIKVKGTDFEK